VAQPGLSPAAAALVLLLSGQAWAGWVPAGQGDCPGLQVWGSAGEAPEAERCTPEFAGKTALCFTQVCYPGCQYIDVATRDCKGGAEMAQVYTCVPESGQVR
jgi:hypothetical protein